MDDQQNHELLVSLVRIASATEAIASAVATKPIEVFEQLAAIKHELAAIDTSIDNAGHRMSDC